MVNKRGWLRIIETSLAILIIFGVLLVVATSNRQTYEKDFSAMLSAILSEASQDNELRKSIAGYDTDDKPSTVDDNAAILTEFKSFVSTRLNGGYNGYEVRICKPEDICSLDAYPLNVDSGIYTEERIISPIPYEPTFSLKKIKIFLW